MHSMLAEKENTTNKKFSLISQKKKKRKKYTLDLANSLSISYTITFTHHEKQKMKKEIIKKTRGSEKEHKVELTQFTMLLANYVYTKKKKNRRTIG